MNIILGSSSPRRKKLLQNLINNFDTYIPNIEEQALPNESPQRYCERISGEKAKSIVGYISNSAPSLIICCDTIVAINNQIIGKPSDFKDAINIIKFLNSKTHEVISSITLFFIKNNKIEKSTRSEISYVTFKDIPENEIIDYLRKIDYGDKAGAYAIQDHGNLIIESLEGSLTNVIGFPLRLFYRMLGEMSLLYKVFLNH